MSEPEPKSSSPTVQLSQWVSKLKLDDIPDRVRTRAKYLILDGLACAFVGSHLPWSETAAQAMLNLEPAQGDASLIGWGGRKVTALTAALLNGTFIQGFELDDWHSEAPLHSNSIILPALLAAAEQANAQASRFTTSGKDFLLATIAGYETGPRVGRSLWGTHVLSSGWHSGAVFGPAAAAASVGKLYGFDADTIEDAFGIACTQSCGLMSAQFESDVKRMHHGFAARNGLLAAVLAQGGYVGIKKVFEREYGGFLKQFSSGNGKQPQYRLEELTSELGTKWQTDGIRIKPYAAMAGTHPSIDCIRHLQEQHPDRMKRFDEIKKIDILLGEAAFHHGGWKAVKPLTATGAQMSNSFTAATQIVHGQVLMPQFTPEMLVDKDVWRLVDLTECKLHITDGDSIGCQEVRIVFEDGTALHHGVPSAFGVDPPLSNEDIVAKWRQLTKGIVENDVVAKIEEMVLSLEEQDDLVTLFKLIREISKNPLAR
ncbi:immune-responsive 1 [Fusarium pseudocircinatum]|uniref:Immune-responsive 1 n=1 Tax=Fusarium pseudocircinatum TaxID=56676 RepID=A0A8H5KXI1_9HYPO|nr:immune-responsive 1 [Fusarium pseudocircinatum]